MASVVSTQNRGVNSSAVALCASVSDSDTQSKKASQKCQLGLVTNVLRTPVADHLTRRRTDYDYLALVPQADVELHVCLRAA